MANIGDQLLQPESGMQRIDDVNINIKYINASYIYDDSNMFNFSNQNRHIINKDGNCEFYIYSSKFYILAGAHHAFDTSYCQIMIDDITYEVSLYTSDTLNNDNNQGSHVVYKFKSDKKSIHHIKLNAIKDFNFDAIDIDEDGRMCTQEEYELQEAKNRLFPVRVADDTVTTEENVANYTATLTNGERQLLLLNNGDMYLSDGNGSHIKMGGSGSSYSEIDSLPTFTNPNK